MFFPQKEKTCDVPAAKCTCEAHLNPLLLAQAQQLALTIKKKHIWQPETGEKMVAERPTENCSKKWCTSYGRFMGIY